MKTIAPYGSWDSPITPDLLVSDAIRLGSIAVDGDVIYWVEARPQENGRQVIVRHNQNGRNEDVLPQEYSARTLAHEYGGRAIAARDGVIYFSNLSDQRVYRMNPGEAPFAISPEPPTERSIRYADFVVTSDGAYLVSVRERHLESEVVNDLVLLSTDGQFRERVLASGCDFYMSPELSSDNTRLVWTCWNHPQMPWDGTQLCEATLNEKFEVLNQRVVAGSVDESISQPKFSADGTLLFISDRSGWWNIYSEVNGVQRCLYSMEAEFAQPAWNFGFSSYFPLGDGTIVCTWSQRGYGKVGRITTDGRLEEIANQWTVIGLLMGTPSGFVMTCASPLSPGELVRYDWATSEFESLRVTRPITIDGAHFSVPEVIEFPTENGRTAHAFFYPPHNQVFEAPEGELPPLLVLSHGGPTANTTAVLDYEIQFWTSRGIGVVDVNYGGSTGYGRAYRERLRGNWGIVDLDDCVNAALFLAQEGKADPKRLLIAGGSAGGYTTLCALTFRDVFAAGASHFGVSDLTALAKDTHKFESRYLDSLVGPWPAMNHVYEERSPINHTDLLKTPIILFQGLEDVIVPPAQSELMVQALKQRGIAHAYVTYEGEQHGFRQAKNIIDAAESELSFYGQILGFTPTGLTKQVQISYGE